MKATNANGLNATGCTIYVPNGGLIELNILPELTDSKGSVFNDEPVIGRSFPIKTYAHGENRSIGLNLYFYADSRDALEQNATYLLWLESAVYPRDADSATNLPFLPPPICKLKCGRMLATETVYIPTTGQEIKIPGTLCAVLKRYNFTAPRDVAWDESTLIPYYFTLSTEWDIVYNNDALPGQEKIING